LNRTRDTDSYSASLSALRPPHGIDSHIAAGGGDERDERGDSELGSGCRDWREWNVTGDNALRMDEREWLFAERMRGGGTRESA